VLTPQVTYFPLPVRTAQEQQAVNVMKGLVAQCLQVDPSSRPPACDVQSDLFDLMVDNGWTNSLAES